MVSAGLESIRAGLTEKAFSVLCLPRLSVRVPRGAWSVENAAWRHAVTQRGSGHRGSAVGRGAPRKRLWGRWAERVWARNSGRGALPHTTANELIVSVSDCGACGQSRSLGISHPPPVPSLGVSRFVCLLPTVAEP